MPRSAAILSAALAAVAIALPAHANGAGGLLYPHPPESGFYATLFGGASLDSTIENVVDFDDVDIPLSDLEPGSGYLAGGAAGYSNALDDMFSVRSEVEFSYRRQSLDFASDELDGFELDGDSAEDRFRILAFLFNVWVDVDLGWFSPYIGAGAGYGRIDFRGEDYNSLAWQAGTGVNFDITRRIYAGVGYRYFRAGFESTVASPEIISVEPLVFGVRFDPLHHDYQSHDFLGSVGVRF